MGLGSSMQQGNPVRGGQKVPVGFGILRVPVVPEGQESNWGLRITSEDREPDCKTTLLSDLEEKGTKEEEIAKSRIKELAMFQLVEL